VIGACGILIEHFNRVVRVLNGLEVTIGAITMVTVTADFIMSIEQDDILGTGTLCSISSEIFSILQ
jgi:hypothetical protein